MADYEVDTFIYDLDTYESLTNVDKGTAVGVGITIINNTSSSAKFDCNVILSIATDKTSGRIDVYESPTISYTLGPYESVILLNEDSNQLFPKCSAGNYGYSEAIADINDGEVTVISGEYEVSLNTSSPKVYFRVYNKSDMTDVVDATVEIDKDLTDNEVLMNCYGFTNDDGETGWANDIETDHEYQIITKKSGYFDTYTKKILSIYNGGQVSLPIIPDTLVSDLVVTVKDDQDNYVENASVYIESYETQTNKTQTTNSSGKTTFSSIPYGYYYIKATHAEYPSYSETYITIDSASELVLLTLETGKASVTFYVYDKDTHLPIEDIKIVFNSNNYKTDSEGKVEILNINPGNYAYHINPDKEFGYNSYSKNISLSAGDIVTVKIYLTKECDIICQLNNILSPFPNICSGFIEDKIMCYAVIIGGVLFLLLII